MKAKDLVRMVEESKASAWRNSLLWREGEIMLEKIADHYKVCSECREMFDAQEYPDETLLGMEKYLANSKLSDWMCRKI